MFIDYIEKFFICIGVFRKLLIEALYRIVIPNLYSNSKAVKRLGKRGSEWRFYKYE